MPIFVALYQLKYNVSYLHSSSSYVTVIVLSQFLLVHCWPYELNIASFIQLIQRILEAWLILFVRVHLNPWGTILEVGGEDRLGSISHEVRHVTSRTVWGSP